MSHVGPFQLRIFCGTWGLLSPFHPDSPRGRAANSGSKLHLKRVHTTGSPFPGIWPLSTSNSPWKIRNSWWRSCTSDGIQARLALWRLLGDSSSCWRKGQGEEPSQPSHPCPTHRTVLQVHCFGQEINSNGCLQRGEALGAVICLPASPPFCTNSQECSQTCYEAGEVILLQLPSTEAIKTKQSGDLHQLHFTAFFNTSQLHKNLWVWILTSDIPVSPHRSHLSWQLLLACPSSVW